MDKQTHLRLLGTELREFLDVTNKEIADFNALADKLDDDQFTRRLRVRVVFSSIEAHISHLKASSMAFSLTEEEMFSAKEQFELLDQRLTSTGKIVENRPSLKENIKIAFKAFSKATSSGYIVDYGTTDAQRFFLAAEIRNRITHPKSAKDWSLSEEDIEQINAAWIWFGQHLANVGKL